MKRLLVEEFAKHTSVIPAKAGTQFIERIVAKLSTREPYEAGPDRCLRW